MRNMVILIDTNVLIDYLITRDPYFEDARKVLELCALGKIEGYVVFHSISNIFFILRKICDNQRRRSLLKDLCTMVKVTGASHSRVMDAIERNDFADFEDCLQDECAQEINADYIITRNTDDFKYAKVKAIEPGRFICKLGEI